MNELEALILLKSLDPTSSLRGLEYFYNEYYRLGLFICGKILLVNDDCYDVINDSFINFYKNKMKITEPKAYFAMLVRNASINKLKEEKKNSDFDEETIIKNSEKVESIDLNELDYLNELEISIIKLHIFGGYSFKEIGLFKKMTTFQISGLYSRAIKKIRKGYQNEKERN